MAAPRTLSEPLSNLRGQYIKISNGLMIVAGPLRYDDKPQSNLAPALSSGEQKLKKPVSTRRAVAQRLAEESKKSELDRKKERAAREAAAAEREQVREISNRQSAAIEMIQRQAAAATAATQRAVDAQGTIDLLIRKELLDMSRRWQNLADLLGDAISHPEKESSILEGKAQEERAIVIHTTNLNNLAALKPAIPGIPPLVVYGLTATPSSPVVASSSNDPAPSVADVPSLSPRAS